MKTAVFTKILSLSVSSALLSECKLIYVTRDKTQLNIYILV